MHNIRKIILSCLFAATLLGCAKTSGPVPQLNQEQRQAILSQFNNWRIAGRLGIRDNNQGYNVSFEWRQKNQDTDLYIYSPFSTQSARISATPSQATITDAEGEVSNSSSAQELILQELGWHLPVNHLVYWLKGLPAPEADVSNEKFDRFKQAQSFVQDGWLVQFNSYELQNNFSLPKSITISKESIKLKILIKTWTPE